MMKKVISVILTAMMVMTAIPSVVFAMGNDNEPVDYFKEYHYNREGVLTTYYVDEDGDVVDLEEEEAVPVTTALPTAYDSRAYDRVTSVKDQNPLGSCWSFAFCAAAESSLISQGYADNSIDLSEAHLLWFRTANYVEGSDIPVQQDKINTIQNTFDDGGNDFDAVSTVARWSGLTTEAKYPYIRSTDTTGMQYDASEMFVNDYNLVSARKLTKNEPEEIKKAIMQYGAVTAQIYYTKDALNYLENGECNHYQKKQSGTNHAVTVVGWDDNYDANKFKTVPLAGNGAWLIKNSWGEDDNDAGFFWLSYYDKSCGDFMEVVAKPSGDYDNNYQYDGVTCTAAIAYTGKAYGANIFTAKGYEKVKGFGLFTFTSASNTITVNLYTKLTDASDPESGVLTATKVITTDKEGYFTADFDGEYSVNPGEKFAIVAKYENNGGTAMIPYESRTTFDFTYGTQAGQSFYSPDGITWTDVTTTTNRGNIPLKAFTTNDSSVIIETNDIVSLTVNTLPKTEYFAGDEVSFDNLTLKAVRKDGTVEIINDGFELPYVDTMLAGEYKVEITYEGLTAEYTINVTDIEIDSLRIAEQPEKTVYTVGDENLDTTGLVVEVVFNNGETIPFDEGFECTGFDTTSAGTKTITVNFEGLTAYYQITVEPKKQEPPVEPTEPDIPDEPTEPDVPDEPIKPDVNVPVIAPKKGSNTVIDNRNMFIYGLDFGIRSLDKYITLADGYTYRCDNYGSGGAVRIMKNGSVVKVYSIVIFGDINGDGWSDRYDLDIANSIYNRRRPVSSISDAQLMASDVNHDGYLDYKDTNILEKTSDLIRRFNRNDSADRLAKTSAYRDYVALLPQTNVKPKEEKYNAPTMCDVICDWLWTCWDVYYSFWF